MRYSSFDVILGKMWWKIMNARLLSVKNNSVQMHLSAASHVGKNSSAFVARSVQMHLTAVRLNWNVLYSLQISLRIFWVRGKSKQEQLPCEQFLQQIEISRTFLRAKQVEVGRKAREISICHKNCSKGSCSYFDFPLVIGNLTQRRFCASTY